LSHIGLAERSEGPNGLESYIPRIRDPGNAVLVAQPICSKHKVVFSLERDLYAKIGRSRITRSGVGFAATWATNNLAEGLDPLVSQNLDVVERRQALLVQHGLSSGGGETHTGVQSTDGVFGSHVDENNILDER
jgi:hypothetical protein